MSTGADTGGAVLDSGEATAFRKLRREGVRSPFSGACHARVETRARHTLMASRKRCTSVLSQTMPITTDCLVIGSGVAGLSLALEAAAHGDVIIVTKRAAEESNTKYAQGGIAAVLSSEDSFDAHIADTLQAGAGLCHELAVEICVKEGPARIQALQDLGAHFDRAGGDVDLDLHLEEGTADGASHTLLT